MCNGADVRPGASTDLDGARRETDRRLASRRAFIIENRVPRLEEL